MNQSNDNIIYIDTREPPPPVLPGIRFVHETLSYGDYRWEGLDGQIVVERKTTNDLINSIKTGRWQRQVPSLVDSGARPILCIERFGLVSLTSGWTFEGLDQAVFSAQLAGCYVCYYYEGRFGSRLLSLFRSTREAGGDTLIPPRRREKGHDRQTTAKLGILASLPGSGPTTARNLLARFGSVSATLDAIKDGSIQGEGIGRSKLTQWRDALGYK